MEKEKLHRIFNKTDGYCHICHRKLVYLNYGIIGANGAWEVDHSIPKSKGGTDNLNNLFASHISCNRQKSNYHTRTARSLHSHTRAPFSKQKKQEIKTTNTAAGGLIGGILGSVFGPFGILIGAGIGAAIGNDNSPKK